MLISFDGINFNWETEDGVNRLIIACLDVGNTEVIQKDDYKMKLESQLTEAIRNVVNSGEWSDGS